MYQAMSNATNPLSINQLAEKAREIRLNVLDMVYRVQSGHIGGIFSEPENLSAL